MLAWLWIWALLVGEKKKMCDCTATPYKDYSGDEPADCVLCGRPLAGDNDSGICYQCRRTELEET